MTEDGEVFGRMAKANTASILAKALQSVPERAILEPSDVIADPVAAGFDPATALRQMVLPSSLSALDGVLAISLSETTSVLAHLPSVRNRTIHVAGVGIVGLAFCHWLKLAGARVIILGRRPERFEKARAVGADAVVNTRKVNWTSQVLNASKGPVDDLIEATGDVGIATEMLTVLSDTGFASAYGHELSG